MMVAPPNWDRRKLADTYIVPFSTVMLSPLSTVILLFLMPYALKAFLTQTASSPRFLGNGPSSKLGSIFDLHIKTLISMTSRGFFFFTHTGS